MEPVNIRYQLRFSVKTEEVNYQLHPETSELISSNSAEAPEWARLDYKKCTHCPLNSKEQPYCPLALHLHELVDKFHDTSSIDEVEMEVTSDTEQVTQTTTLQYAVASMLDIVYPASGCPKTRLMRPLARFHVPVSSEEEKVYRIASMYLLAQFFREKTDRSGDFDFKGLIEFYSDMNILNKAIATRIKGATRSDSVKNAIALMDMYSTLVPLMLEDGLVELRDIFRDFLPEEVATAQPAIKSNYLERIKTAKLELVLDDDEEPDDEPKSKSASEPNKTVDQILKNSKLSLELVPDDEENDKPQ